MTAKQSFVQLPGAGGSSTLLQTFEYAIAGSVNTPASFYSNVINQNFTIQAGSIVLADFSCCFLNNANQGITNFRLTVDAVTQVSASQIMSNASHITHCGMSKRITGLAAGVHAFHIDWLASIGSQSTVDTALDGYHMILRLMEVTV